MIFTDRTIIVQKGTSSINDTIVLYRGDKGVEIRFTLNEGSPFRFGSGASPNIIEKTEAAYGQLVIKTPNDLPSIFSEIVPTNEGKIVFTITAEMIDEITEVGNYTFQIRLLDENRNSRATLPEVVNGIEIREPIATEDVTTTNEVEVATVGYALTTAGVSEDAFDAEGNYNKTDWRTGDRITADKLNKIEAGIDGVNKKVASAGTSGGSNINDTTASATTTYSSNKIENIKENLSSQINAIENNMQNIGNPTDEQISTAIETYLASHPITIENMWSDLIEGEIYEVQAPAVQIGISAIFTQGNNTIYEGSSVDSLKSMLVVTKIYNDDTTEVTSDYTLSGTLTVGTSTITVTNGAFTTTFDVTVSETPTAELSNITAVYTQSSTVTPSTALDDLKSDIVVTANYSDGSTAIINDYTLSGTLTVGTSTITITYEGKTTTINVNVTADTGYTTTGLKTYYNFTQYEDGYTGSIEELSGCNVSPIITGLESYESGRNGIIGGKFMINAHRSASSSLNIPVSCINQYPFSIELYAAFRTGYNEYSPNGTLALKEVNRASYQELLSTREGGSAGKGYLFRIIPDTKLFNIAGNTDIPSINFENTGITYADATEPTMTPTHIVINVGGPNGEYSLYVNGKCIDSKTPTGAILLDGDRTLRVNTSDVYIVRVYDKILTQSEVTKNYNDVLTTIGGGN